MVDMDAVDFAPRRDISSSCRIRYEFDTLGRLVTGVLLRRLTVHKAGPKAQSDNHIALAATGRSPRSTMSEERPMTHSANFTYPAELQAVRPGMFYSSASQDASNPTACERLPRK